MQPMDTVKLKSVRLVARNPCSLDASDQFIERWDLLKEYNPKRYAALLGEAKKQKRKPVRAKFDG